MTVGNMYSDPSDQVTKSNNNSQMQTKRCRKEKANIGAGSLWTRWTKTLVAIQVICWKFLYFFILQYTSQCLNKITMYFFHYCAAPTLHLNKKTNSTKSLFFVYQVVEHPHESLKLLLPNLPLGMCWGPITCRLRDPWTRFILCGVQHHQIVWSSSASQCSHLKKKKSLRWYKHTDPKIKRKRGTRWHIKKQKNKTQKRNLLWKMPTDDE